VIGVPAALLIGIVLLLSLLLWAMRNTAADRELSARSDVELLEDGAELAPCPPEFVARIFESSDWQFVSNTKSPQLQRLFRRERKLVALLWVQQTSSGIARIMREHKEASRESRDLNFATETKLVFLYAELKLICGLLSLAIRSAGPLRVRGLAVYADSLSRRLAQTQQDFRTVTTGREFHGAGSS
jgi:hypothetical protein